ncbi:protein tyrosine kinase, partial [Ostertagia ostertagi]
GADVTTFQDAAADRHKVHITKIRDSLAGGLHSVKNEDYFHGFLPKEQEQFIISVRKSLPSEDVGKHAQQKNNNQTKTDDEVEVSCEGRGSTRVSHSWPLGPDPAILAKTLTLENCSPLHHRFRGLIEYHRRNHIAFDEDGTLIKRAIKRAEWQLNHEQIVKTKKLGDGAFGDVYKGVLHCGLIDSKEVAIKTILGTVSTEENEKLFRVCFSPVLRTAAPRIYEFLQEAMLMRRLVHPNVVMLIGVASNEEPVMIVMEFAQGGSVLDAVQQQPGPSIYVRIKYCNHAALGLSYLSKQGIIHRDVAARNCLIGKHDTAKISDFGLSIVGTQKKEKTLKKVPVRYLAPGNAQEEGIYRKNRRVEFWSVRVGVYVTAMFRIYVFHDGKEPYGEMNAKEVRKYVLGGNTLDNESDHYPQHMWSITTVGTLFGAKKSNEPIKMTWTTFPTRLT